MVVLRGELWIADLNPSHKSEPGKIRPIVIIQNNILNENDHESVIVCPLSSQVKAGINILRVLVEEKEGGLTKDGVVLIDQVRAIHRSRLQKKIGELPPSKMETISKNLKIVMDL